MKRITFVLLLTAWLLSGCGKQEPEVPSFDAPAETTVPVAEATISLETTSPVSDPSFSFADLEFITFRFSSGAGGWGTTLTIHPDGSFTGNFYDSNMGITEPEYPNGSVSLSDFTGQFSQPVWVNAYTATLKITDIRYEKEPGTTEIRDGIQYSYGTAYGLTETEELLLYLPGVPLEELPEDYLPWADLYEYEGTTLPHYGLYNPGHGTGFYSYNILDQIREHIQIAEEAALQAEEALDTATTQADMNVAAQQQYLIWDGALNELWAVLKQVLDEDAMRQLTNEELQWIEEKEQAALDAAAEYEGGSLYPTVYYGKLADLTRERVYELLEYLPK